MLLSLLLSGCARSQPADPSSGSSGDPPAGQTPGDQGGSAGSGQDDGNANNGGQDTGDTGGDAGQPGGADNGAGDPAAGDTAWIDAASSPFAVRGVVEGFYGDPWTQDDRISALEFMSRVGLNTYVYAPKDDAYQREKWRSLYPEDLLSQFQTLMAKAGAGEVNFVYSISPGLDITYSSKADRDALEAKIDQLRGIGVTTFMLSLDDVPEKLNQTDAAAYGGDYALAQADLANWLLDQEIAGGGDGFTLWMTPTHYSGTKADDYLTTLGAKLDQAVQLLWTGPEVLSPAIDAASADAFGAAVKRKVIIWDNYPVNDYTYAIYNHPRLILGPLRGRSADLAYHVGGYLLNPMIQEEASQLPLYTAAAYLADPYGYDPDAAWREAASHLAAGAGSADSAAAAILLEFASYAQMSVVQPAEAPALGDAVSAYQPGSAESVEALRARFEAMTTMPARLEAAVPADLYSEFAPWVEALRDKGLAGLVALDLDRAVVNGDKAGVKTELPAVEQDLAALQAEEQTAYIAGQIVDGFLQGVIARAQAFAG